MRLLWSVLSVTFVIAYPVLSYLALTRLGTRGAALAIGGLALGVGQTRLTADNREQLLRSLRPALLVLICAVGAAGFDESRFLLVTPVAVNLALLATFAASLRQEIPLVERFARMQHSDLTAAEQRYCRSVTITWCGFFVLNAAAAGGLALWSTPAWWAFYTGGIAYLAMGLLFGTEYLVRKYRFQRFGDALHDRILRRVLGRSQ